MPYTLSLIVVFEGFTEEQYNKQDSLYLYFNEYDDLMCYFPAQNFHYVLSEPKNLSRYTGEEQQNYRLSSDRDFLSEGDYDTVKNRRTAFVQVQQLKSGISRIIRNVNPEFDIHFTEMKAQQIKVSKTPAPAPEESTSQTNTSWLDSMYLLGRNTLGTVTSFATSVSDTFNAINLPSVSSLADQQAEIARQAAEQAEIARQAAEQAEIARQAAERVQKEKEEAERLGMEQQEAERVPVPPPGGADGSPSSTSTEEIPTSFRFNFLVNFAKAHPYITGVALGVALVGVVAVAVGLSLLSGGTAPLLAGLIGTALMEPLSTTMGATVLSVVGGLLMTTALGLIWTEARREDEYNSPTGSFRV